MTHCTVQLAPSSQADTLVHTYVTPLLCCLLLLQL
jgi:hypothetical protein